MITFSAESCEINVEEGGEHVQRTLALRARTS